MNPSRESLKKVLEYTLPWLVLAILLAYSYADFFRHPYGFWWGTHDGTISKVFVIEREPTIHVGDQLVRVGTTDLQTFDADLRRDLFQGVKPGEVVPITIRRGGQLITVEWRLPGTNPGELRDQLFGEWFLAYFFWFAGTVTLLVLRPRDTRWLLLAAFDYVSSLWLITGSGLSFFHIWYSALVLRMAIWLSLPVYLHLHWVFPRPLGRLHPLLLWLGYAAGIGLALAQWFQLLPGNLYVLAFLLAVAGSLALLLIHFARQPDIRRELVMLLIAAIFAIVPMIILGILTAVAGSMSPLLGLGFLSFPILPFAYLFAAYRRQAGGLEVRGNRVFTIYAFLILLGTLMVSLLVAGSRLPIVIPDQFLILGMIATAIATALSLWVFPLFQNFVERRFLGIAIASRQLQQAYSSHITGSTSFARLTGLLRDEIMPSLLVRQFVFLIQDGSATRVLLNIGVERDHIPTRNTGDLLERLAGNTWTVASPRDDRLSWIRLALPLKLEQDLLGLWLFGRRDPDDTYSSIEVPILRSFADQAAVALSNILQTERLRALYRANINRHENERLSLARELHDSVLNELAGMLMNADMASLPRSFQDGYQALTQRLREIVSDLRPPMLSYGLKPAIEELADNLMERSKIAVSITVDFQSTGERYPPDKEQHLFRIVQEACENALRHSHGQKVKVSGSLESNHVELQIEDNGDGFELGRKPLEIQDLVSERHFGLAGMYERAGLIGAQIGIASAPGSGTVVSISWTGEPGLDSSDQDSGDFSS